MGVIVRETGKYTACAFRKIVRAKSAPKSACMLCNLPTTPAQNLRSGSLYHHTPRPTRGAHCQVTLLPQ
jgi:hypothetical protein